MATVKRKKKVRRPRKKQQGIPATQILIVAGAAVLIVAVLVILNSNRPQTTVSELSYEMGITPDGEPYKGSPEAALQLVEYSDFRCGHCGNFAETLDALGPDYVETGKVQIIFRNFAFLSPESIQAAQAAECALDQGAEAFWHYHDLLFANRGGGAAAYSNSRLKTYARQIGLDTSTFNTCLDSGAKAGEVQADLDEGKGQDVEATPTWFLNGQIVRGAIPESEIRQLFEDMLSQEAQDE
jgi:protein-disulfide isomerase